LQRSIQVNAFDLGLQGLDGGGQRGDIDQAPCNGCRRGQPGAQIQVDIQQTGEQTLGRQLGAQALRHQGLQCLSTSTALAGQGADGLLIERGHDRNHHRCMAVAGQAHADHTANVDAPENHRRAHLQAIDRAGKTHHHPVLRGEHLATQDQCDGHHHQRQARHHKQAYPKGLGMVFHGVPWR
jgi:hypothetical protein